ncbi:MAG TPA: histidine kinase [Segeticoccus sp.]|uniref:histidine kinase n=1 Tax=Segeticoccus sp. TaxID=2706531 RepID=UPI002D7F6D01|nr:histidine kinase [Segeticoccus sp.]HET8600991.1 histidine kinase [Segeticoccus sp.]
MIAVLAVAAGVTIENAQLYERASQQRQWSETISELTRILLENQEEGQALQPLMLHAVRTASASFVAVALVDDADELVVCAAHAEREVTSQDLGAVSVGSVLTGSMWHAVREARRPLLILSGTDEGDKDDPQGPQLLKELNADGPVAVLPISVGSDDLGLLLLAWDETVAGAPDETLSALAEFAQQTGLVLVAGRAQRDRSLMALLGDRERIARGMHNHVIQRLFTTGLSLQAADRLAQHPLVRERLDRAVDDLDEAIRHIRHTIFELHQPIPSGGVREQLHTLVESAGPDADVPTMRDLWP